MAKRRLGGKRIAVTGASSGIGRCLSLRLAAAGAKLVITARREELLYSLQTEIRDSGGLCEVVVGDITQSQTHQDIVSASANAYGGLDCLVNNAGVGAMGPFAEATIERLREIFEVNFFSMASMIRAAVPALESGEDALIVNIGSVLGHRAVPLKSEYCAAKFALHGFSDSLRAELASVPIEVLLISPSTVDSDFFDSAIEDSTSVNWKKRGSMEPDFVARKIIAGMQKRNHEIILPLSGKALVWLDRLFPTIANRIVSRYGGG